ncbi:MAG: hypothetical protein JOZ72_16040 [Alphaproteobacteria bacterium]|nr:hypothetical protein [Alphaproteobacteria bacterium]
MRILPLGFLAFLFASPAAADCLRPVVEPARLALEAAQPKQDMATDVTPREAAAIAAMKTRLRTYVAATAACGGDDPKVLQTVLASGAPKLDFAVRRFAPDLVAIAARFSIQCGNDTMLSVFRHGHEVLHAQSAPYKTIAGAWDMFDYALSPPDKTGQWFAVTKTVAPWCSSTWSEIRYAVWRPGRAEALFKASDFMWWGNEDYGRLTVNANDFTLRFHSSSIDDGRHDREWVRHFAVQGGKVVRVAPFANGAMDFVEEWIQSDWKDARAWTAPAILALVKDVHQVFHAKPFGEFQSVRRCPGGALEIEVNPAQTTGSLFFQVTGQATGQATGTPKDFRLTGLANAADPRCAGKNLFDPEKPDWL